MSDSTGDSAAEELEDDIGKLLAAQPHDAFFQSVFSQPARAALMFQRHLPPGTVAVINWETLRTERTSFIKSSLQRRHSDLLFSAESRGGPPVFFHILFEHQTSVDHTMPLRLLGYMVEIWNGYAAEHPGEPLPVVVPFVLHQGPDRWTVSTRFSELFALPAATERDLRDYLPDFTHALLDLTRQDPAADEEHPELQTVLLLMKLAREQDEMMRFLQWLAPRANRVAGELLRLCLLYSLHADTDLDLEVLAVILEENPKLKDTAMSTAMRLRAEGKAEGEARGLWMGKLLMLEKVLGLPASPLGELEALDAAAIEARFAALELQYNERFKQR